MRYERMLPYQVTKAIEDGVPAVLPIGVLEYHAQHLPLRVDMRVVEGVLERLEKEHPEMVILPSFIWGAASYAVAGPGEGRGTVHVEPDHISAVAGDMFLSLLRVGFRNIHGFVFHQSENFIQGMPTDLAFRLAGRRTVFNFLDETRGKGWWGDESMSDYYAGNDPFAWIQIHAMSTPEINQVYPIDHAGLVETSLMMALAPEDVDMSRFSPKEWFCREAVHATPETGEKIVAMYLDNLRSILFPKK